MGIADACHGAGREAPPYIGTGAGCKVVGASRGRYKPAMHELLASAGDTLLVYGQRVAVAGLACLALELAFPASRTSLRSRLRGTMQVAAYIAITVGFFTVFNKLWASLGIQPLMNVDLSFLTMSPSWPVRVFGWVFAPLAIGAVAEFFYYWFHRAQHTVPFLWRFHEVHHSVREMSALNCNHHWTEEIFRVPVITIPLSLLFRFNPGYVPTVIYFVIGLQGLFEHSCTRLHFGPFRYLLPDNRFHRIHHSIHPQDWGRNFGSGCLWWDIVFRTARFPRPGEWPEVGVPGVEEPRTLRDFLVRPFRRRDGTMVAAPVPAPTRQPLEPSFQPD